MPHIIIETCLELEQLINFKEYFPSLHKLFNQVDPSFDPNSCKSRLITIPTNCYLSGLSKENKFIHVTVKILPGRNKETKTNLINKIKEFFIDLIKNFIYKVNLSIEITELNKEFYCN